MPAPTGYKRSETDRKAISERMRGNYHGAANRGRKRPNNNGGRAGQTQSVEERQKRSVSMQAAWADPEKSKKLRKRKMREYKPSSLERQVHMELDYFGIGYKIGPVVETPEGRFKPDLLLETGKYVEVNGCYWHGCQECYPQNSDFRKKHESKMSALAGVGVFPEHIWEHELIRDQQ